MRLKNGSEELPQLVAATMQTLRHLFDDRPLAFYDAAMVARSPAYKPFGANGKMLSDLGLLGSDGAMHASVRNVILSATEGAGLNLRLVSPEA